ncbi:uncharacterized protein LOC111646959 [Seriola lalandi dorsalis]|uniref:uncharacterized protein LOC111646959 n=1 Tax=Seriola lalandi dorsalis TaxID=1841481 RepID=UPI000C6F6063|nr:uncharacterized protein LOC111646959 [Seriola lalandi dorsalis]
MNVKWRHTFSLSHSSESLLETGSGEELMSNLLRTREPDSRDRGWTGDKYDGCTSQPPQRSETRPRSRPASAELPHPSINTTMHCGNLLFLFLWAELVAGRPLKDTNNTQLEMQSIIADLQKALEVYSSVLQKTDTVRALPVLPCTVTTVPPDQNSTLVKRLSDYQGCAERLRSLCPDVTTLCRVVTLNQDLLQHLEKSHQDSGCPTSSPPPPDFDSMLESIQCVQCWSQEVKALRR